MIRLGPLVFFRSLRGSASGSSLRIPSETRCIRKVSSRILSSLEPLGLEEGTLFDIRLCIEEAVRNAIVHGNRSDRRRVVNVAYRIEGQAITIEVEDEGEGFDFGKLADPTKEAHILKNSGRGVYLMRKLMDKVEYTDNGRKVTMVKKLK
jgi:serine/threonine-protein kinase RsbW